MVVFEYGALRLDFFQPRLSYISLSPDSRSHWTNSLCSLSALSLSALSPSLHGFVRRCQSTVRGARTRTSSRRGAGPSTHAPCIQRLPCRRGSSPRSRVAAAASSARGVGRGARSADGDELEQVGEPRLCHREAVHHLCAVDLRHVLLEHLGQLLCLLLELGLVHLKVRAEVAALRQVEGVDVPARREGGFGAVPGQGPGPGPGGGGGRTHVYCSAYRHSYSASFASFR